jgi:hypothetical protein
VKYGRLGDEEETLNNSGPHRGSVSFNIPARWRSVGVM